MCCYSYHLICFKKSSVKEKWKPLMLVARLVELWKKIFFLLGLPKNNIVKIQLVFQKLHRKLINTLRFMTYQKDCIWLLNKFRKNSYLEKCVQNSKKGWLYVTYDDRLSILGQRNSHTPLDIICSILARVHSNKSGKFCGTLSMISSNNRHTPRSLIMYIHTIE